MSQNTINGEVLIVSTTGAIRRDGRIIEVKDGKAVFKGGRTHTLGQNDLVLKRLSPRKLGKLEQDTPVLLCQEWGCGGRLMTRGFFAKPLNRHQFCFANRKDGQAVPVNIEDYGNGVYQVLWQYVPDATETKVVIVTTNGEVVADGKLESLDGDTLVLKSGRQILLKSNHLLLTRIGAAELENLDDNTPVVLSKNWGCGGSMMYRGFFTGFLGEKSFCFSTRKNGGGEEVSLEQFPTGTFRVLWAK